MTARVVFDCMVYLQAAANPRRVAPCFAAAAGHEMEVCLSDAALSEIRDVLSRPALRARFPALTPAAVAIFLAEVVSQATIIVDVPARFSLPRDPKDEKWIDLAIAAGARFLVTRDRDLLDLRNDASAAATLREACPSLQILDPEQFVGLTGQTRPR